MKEVLNTANAPAAIGPYSQSIRTGGFLFISGQIPIDPATGNIDAQDIPAQTRQALKNMQAILENAGLTMKNVVKTTVFMTDLTKFTDMNAVYSEFFTEDCPARSAIQVGALPKGAMVEIEAIAAY
ncbi:MAG: RidA family protein [Clostridiales bacterium]|nr:RidA family protein [Clostridiales bacterium]